MDVAQPKRQVGRDLGRREVLAALGQAGHATRTELADRTGLSRSTVAAIVNGLVEQGVVAVAEGDPARLGRGRPAARVRLADPTGMVLGIDIGNSHVHVVVGTPAGEIRAEADLPRDPDGLASEAMDLAAQLATVAMTSAGCTSADVLAAVMGVPAPVAGATSQIAMNNILPSWVDIDPAEEIGRRLGVPVRAENDANLGAVGEWRFGAGAGHDAMIYVKVATGIGAGLLLDGRLFRGVGGMAGEIGHVQIDADGQLCRCGARGCLETVVSVPRMLNALRPVLDSDLDIPGLRDLLVRQHPNAMRVTADTGRHIGRVLADSCTLLNPSRIVVGGPLREGNTTLARSIESAVERYAHPGAVSMLTVVAGQLRGRAEVLGALAVAGDMARDLTRI